MIVSKFELMMFTLRPMTPASAAMRSASIPITVWPSGATNSLGAYWASLAMFSVPFALILAGTVAAIAESVLTCAGLPLSAVVLELDVVLLLLPQPASARIASAGTPIRANRLLIAFLPM